MDGDALLQRMPSGELPGAITPVSMQLTRLREQERATEEARTAEAAALASAATAAAEREQALLRCDAEVEEAKARAAEAGRVAAEVERTRGHVLTGLRRTLDAASARSAARTSTKGSI